MIARIPKKGCFHNTKAVIIRMKPTELTPSEIQFADRYLSAASAAFIKKEAKNFKRAPASNPSARLDRRITSLTGDKTILPRKRSVWMVPILCAVILSVFVMTAAAVPAVRNAVAEQLDKLSRHFGGFTEEDLLPGGQLYFTPHTEGNGMTDDTDGIKDQAQISSDAEAAVTEAHAPVFDDPKLYIYDRMLNAVHYYDEVALTFTYPYGRVSCAYDMKNGRYISHETPTDGFPKTIICDGFTVLNAVDAEPIWWEISAPPVLENTVPFTDVAKAITIDGDGMLNYNGHADFLGPAFAGYCLDPQNLAFRFLKDFSMWEIDEECAYLGRTCICITGKINDFESSRVGGTAFTMLADKESGILLRLTVRKDATAYDYVCVTELSFDHADIPTLEELGKELSSFYAYAILKGSSSNTGLFGDFVWAVRPAQQAFAERDLKNIEVYDAEMEIGTDGSLLSLRLTVGNAAQTQAGILEITPDPSQNGYNGVFTSCAVPYKEPFPLNFYLFNRIFISTLTEHPSPAGIFDAADYFLNCLKSDGGDS